ncbi:MAG: site-specific DNA-methyltransferase [Chloroflexota bacterium]
MEIKPAKGRPMLTWVGKKPLRRATAYPAQLIETFHAQSSIKNRKSETEMGLLFHGDNKDVLAYLLANGFRGKVKLIYIDPPFDSGADYVRKVILRGAESSGKLEGETYGLGEQIQYTDIWTNDSYLQFMYERVLLLKELLSEDGSIYIHCDPRKDYYLRSVLDEVFGQDSFRNEIVWKRSGVHSSTIGFGPVHDTILFYSKSGDFIWNPQYSEYADEYVDSWFSKVDENGRKYGLVVCSAPGDRRGTKAHYQWKGLWPPAGRHWSQKFEKMQELEKRGLIEYSSNGVPYVRKYFDESPGLPVNDIWLDTGHIKSLSKENVNYPTQKPENLIERIVSASSDENDIVLDCFLGSGTTAAVAQRLGRRWIGADINKGAIQTTLKRLQGVIQEQAESAKGKVQALPGLEAEETPAPAQLGFAVYRVNDYDLQIQHNEAFNLAVEHLGMTRTKTDAYFDGTLGRKLVKIVPFNHPITALDLEEVKKELNHRPEEERDIVLVGLGKEYAVEVWLEEWNKLRKQGNIPNKIEVIELRSDPKYGGFFTHEPAKAKVAFKRAGDKVEITIDDFISPTILERLKQQNKDNPLFSPQVSDWRSMVDSVMIDSAYDGKVFNITLANVPEKKNDLVEGKYAVEAKKGATIAVKVTDMLGEEVLVVKSV